MGNGKGSTKGDTTVDNGAESRRSTSAGSSRAGRTLFGGILLAAHWLILLTLVTVTLVTAIVLDQSSRLFMLKIVLAGAFALLPAWIYLMFISTKGQRLYDEFVINLHRLRIDRLANLPAPPQHTTYYADWRHAREKVRAEIGHGTTDNLYRAKFEAIYGVEAVSTRALIDSGRPRRLRDRTQNFAPVVLTTFLLAVGWALVVQPEGLRQYSLIPSLSGLPRVPYEPICFGFIGAYWFILQDLVRRYYREDLKTDAYISAATRLVVVAVLVTTMALVPIGTAGQQQVLAFFVGVFPQIGLEVIKAGIHVAFRRLVPTLRTEHPLSSLDGLTVWDQARLLEEGIEDLENLATANLVDVLLSMRIPVARLVDWLDQAILLTHLPPSAPQDNKAYHGLRALGLRTATDLEAAWAEATDDGRQMISDTIFEADRSALRGDALLTAIGREANIAHVRAFRSRDWLQDPTQLELAA